MHLIDQELQLMLRGQFDKGWEISEKLEAIGEGEIRDPAGKKNPEMWLRHNFNRGWFLIQQGKYNEGSQLLESGRFLNVYGSGHLKTNKPIWRNEDLAGKTVILSLEGGFGDEIIHVRFAKSLAAKGARVLVAADPRISGLFERVDGVSQVIQRDQAMEIEHDFWIPGFSAGWLAGHNLADLPQDPYITPLAESVELWKKIINGDKIKIGIRWSGNPDFEHQQFRTFSPEYLTALAQHPELQLYSLQRDNDVRELPDNIVDLQHLLLSWEDTAAAIANLDLVISSCTSVAHLAAAMGKPTWVLTPILPYHTWAYRAPENTTSPWYKSVTLYRQTKFADWSETFVKLHADITEKFALTGPQPEITAENTTNSASMLYNPDFFEPKDIEHAKDIILGYHDMSFDKRWDLETNWTKDILLASRTLGPDSIVLDWGTGIGRIAKMLIDTFGCQVIGVDINEKMLDYARDYVNDSKFSTMTFDEFADKKFNEHFTHATATWVLQHSPSSHVDIEMIRQALKVKGHMFVLDMTYKCIPKKSKTGDQHATEFYDDQINNRQELEKFFAPVMLGKMPTAVAAQSLIDVSWWGLLERQQ